MSLKAKTIYENQIFDTDLQKYDIQTHVQLYYRRIKACDFHLSRLPSELNKFGKCLTTEISGKPYFSQQKNKTHTWES